MFGEDLKLTKVQLCIGIQQISYIQLNVGQVLKFNATPSIVTDYSLCSWDHCHAFKSQDISFYLAPLFEEHVEVEVSSGGLASWVKFWIL